MNTSSDNIESKEELTVYGKIAVSVFIIIVGLSYLIPSIFPGTDPYFPDGINHITAGILILSVNILNAFKGIKYEPFLLSLAAIALVIGVNKAFTVEIKFLPIILVIFGFTALFTSIKNLKN